MSVHYKFKSTLEFDTITFDGLHISVNDLKKAIIQQKRLGKITDFDLQIINAQTKEEYNEESTLIPKNTSLIIARIPLAHNNKKTWDIMASAPTKALGNVDGSNLDLSKMIGSEEDKIQAMMVQSTAEYDPKSYQKLKGQSQFGEVPASYRCNKCKKGGHWIKNCPLINGKEIIEVKRNTGIPRSFRENKEMVIAAVYHEPVFAIEKKHEVPDDLICGICKDIFTDAVMIPCCGSSFCDDCVRTALLESEDNECPDCKEKGSSPGSLIPNRFLRNSVNAFKNETGYKPKIIFKQPNSTEDIKENQSNKVEPLQNKDKTECEFATESTKVEMETSNSSACGDKRCEKTEDLKNEKSKVTSPQDDVESDFEDNIIVTMPPAKSEQRVLCRDRPYNNRNTRISAKSQGIEKPSCNHSQMPPPIQSQSEVRPNIVMHTMEWEPEYHNVDMNAVNHRNVHMPTTHMLGPYPLNDIHDHSLRQPNEVFPNSVSQMCSYPQMANHPQIMPGHPMQPPPINNFENMYAQMGPRPNMGFNRFPSFPRLPYHNERTGYIPLRGSSNDIRPPVHASNLDYVYQGVAAKVGTGIIDDPLEAFNRIMKEKEKRKEERRRSSDRRRSRSAERHQRSRRISPYDHRSKRDSFSKDKRHRSRNRDTRRYYDIDRDKSKRRKHSDSYSDKSSRSGSWSNSPPRKRSKSIIRSQRSWSKTRNKQLSNSMRSFEKNHNQQQDRQSRNHRLSVEKEAKGISKGNFNSSEGISNIFLESTQNNNQPMKSCESNLATIIIEPPPPGFENASLFQDIHLVQTRNKVERNEKFPETYKIKNHTDFRNSKSLNDTRIAKKSNSKEIELKTEILDENSKVFANKSEKFGINNGKDVEVNVDTLNPQFSQQIEKADGELKELDAKDYKRNRDRKKKKERKEKTDKRRIKKDKRRDRSKQSESPETNEIPYESMTLNVQLNDKPKKLSQSSSLENSTAKKNNSTSETPTTKESVLLPINQRLDSVLDINDYETDFGELMNSQQDVNKNLPALENSKWEKDEPSGFLLSSKCEHNPADEENIVTTEIIRKAENAIFTRAINAIRNTEINKNVNTDQNKSNQKNKADYENNNQKSDIQSFQITVPVNESLERSVEIKTDLRKESSSPRIKSIKERLGSKIISKTSLPSQICVSTDRSYKNSSKDNELVFKNKTIGDEKLHRDSDYEYNKPKPNSGEKDMNRQNKIYQRAIYDKPRPNFDSVNRKYSSRKNDYFCNRRILVRNKLKGSTRYSDHREAGHSDRSNNKYIAKVTAYDTGERKSNRRSKKSLNERNVDDIREKSDTKCDHIEIEEDKKKTKSAPAKTSIVQKNKTKNPFSSTRSEVDFKIHEKYLSRRNSIQDYRTDNSSASCNNTDCDTDDQKRKKKHKYKKDKKRVKRSVSLDSSIGKRKHKKKN